jgi:hypothetical protein
MELTRSSDRLVASRILELDAPLLSFVKPEVVAPDRDTARIWKVTETARTPLRSFDPCKISLDFPIDTLPDPCAIHFLVLAMTGKYHGVPKGLAIRTSEHTEHGVLYERIGTMSMAYWPRRDINIDDWRQSIRLI